MGAVRNSVLSILAVGVLVVGLLVLIPEPVRAVQAAAPNVVLAASGSTITTTVTSELIIPQGNLVPLEYAEVIFADGTATPAFTGGLQRIASPLRTCVGQVSNWGGVSSTFGTFSGTGYSIVPDPNGYGYGYSFGSTTDDPLPGYSGTGYGYGSTTADLHVTVTVVVENCPLPADFNSQTFRQFHVQLFVGGGSANGFSSVPSLLNLRNPLVTPPTVSSTSCDTSPSTLGCTDSTPTVNVNVVDSGATTTYGLQLQAGSSVDGSDFVSGSVVFTPEPGVVSAATFLESATITFNQPIPDGANLQITFNDLETADGGTFPAGSSAFGIPAGDLGTRTGGLPFAGFFSLTMSGLGAGQTASNSIDMTIILKVPLSYFTGGQTVANFHLVHYNDAGTFVENIACSALSAAGADPQRLSCTITTFSSFAMVSSAFSTGGGGGGSSVVTGSTTLTTTPSTSVSTSVTTSVTSTDSQSQTGSDTASSTKKPKGGSAPGLELPVLALGLVAFALVVRRKLK